MRTIHPVKNMYHKNHIGGSNRCSNTSFLAVRSTYMNVLTTFFPTNISDIIHTYVAPDICVCQPSLDIEMKNGMLLDVMLSTYIYCLDATIPQQIVNYYILMGGEVADVHPIRCYMALSGKPDVIVDLATEYQNIEVVLHGMMGGFAPLSMRYQSELLMSTLCNMVAEHVKQYVIFRPSVEQVIGQAIRAVHEITKMDGVFSEQSYMALSEIPKLKMTRPFIEEVLEVLSRDLKCEGVQDWSDEFAYNYKSVQYRNISDVSQRWLGYDGLATLSTKNRWLITQHIQKLDALLKDWEKYRVENALWENAKFKYSKDRSREFRVRYWNLVLRGDALTARELNVPEIFMFMNPPKYLSNGDVDEMYMSNQKVYLRKAHDFAMRREHLWKKKVVNLKTHRPRSKSVVETTSVVRRRSRFNTDTSSNSSNLEFVEQMRSYARNAILRLQSERERNAIEEDERKRRCEQKLRDLDARSCSVTK